MKITVPAAQVNQGDLSLYTTSLTVRQLMQNGFYSIDHLDPETGQTGYQRVLQASRAKRLADYIIKGQDTKDAFLPTSVFLATDKNIDFDSENNKITFDIDEIGGFSVVDGQHRLEGLRIAVQKDPRVLNFEVPVNIAYKLPLLHQMCHFLIVNTTQKSVDKGIEQQIISRLTESLDVEDIPNLPQWIKYIVAKGETDKALKMAKYLNETEGSPWQGKILMANQIKKEKPTATINQATFVKAINQNILVASNPLLSIDDPERQRKMLLNYWAAISNLLDPGEGLNTVLYKYTGFLVFSIFSISFFHKLSNDGDYRVETMERHLKNCFDNIEGEYSLIGTPEWWMSGTGQASSLNSSTARRVASIMAQGLSSTAGKIIL
ncbi:MAG: DGQHR domain-containing protein [Candidatus Halichondribacter symbioticus]